MHSNNANTIIQPYLGSEPRKKHAPARCRLWMLVLLVRPVHSKVEFLETVEAEYFIGWTRCMLPINTKTVKAYALH